MMDSRIAQPRASLPRAFEDQDEQFARAFKILQNAIAHRVFPAASVSVTYRGKLAALKSMGNFVYGREPKNLVQPDTMFDVASLTKIIATTPMAMVLYERGLLDLDAPVCAIVPEFLTATDSRRRHVSVRMLLAHCSGLPAYERLFLKAKTRQDLLDALFSVPLTADPGSRTEYSDIGFMILGIALARVADESLDRFCQREIFAPVGMAKTTFHPPASLSAQIPPTADEREESANSGWVAQDGVQAAGIRSTWRNRIIQGEVQDENASVLGGVAGHAGLFSSALDLAQFAECMLACGEKVETAPDCSPHFETGLRLENFRPVLRPDTISLFARRESSPSGTSRALGWDTPSKPSQSGKYFSQESFGHLGYTGTSLWIDPVRRLSVTLLTNRTWPDCLNQSIKMVRPEFYDAIVEGLATELSEKS